MLSRKRLPFRIPNFNSGPEGKFLCQLLYFIYPHGFLLNITFSIYSYNILYWYIILLANIWITRIFCSSLTIEHKFIAFLFKSINQSKLSFSIGVDFSITIIASKQQHIKQTSSPKSATRITFFTRLV